MARKRKKDQAEQQTDLLLEELEKKIAAEYSVALKEAQEKYDKFAAKFQQQDDEQKKKLKEGKITQDEYDRWRTNKLYTSQRYQDLVNVMAEDLARVDQKAMSIANGYMPEAYALNFNYTTYEVEQGTNINTGFTLYSRETVEKLVKDNEITLPKRKVDIPLDQQWNKKHINSAILQGVLQGDSIPDISKRLKQVTDMDRRAAVRNARTMMTGAQNSGRMGAYERAAGLGISIQKEWMATLDDRTRDSHQKLDGERVDWKKPFSNELMYPGDPSGDPSEVYNCRCTMVPFYPEYANIITERVTYSEWKDNHNIVETVAEKPEFLKKFEKQMLTLNVQYNEVQNNSRKLSEKEIIEEIGGGDRTSGSCASVALAYVGQKQGWDVHDFRGGQSMNFFANKSNKVEMFNDLGVATIVSNSAKSSLTNAKRIFSQLEEGKEYYLSAGRHAAIVRINDDVPQYLELQTTRNNGWTDIRDLGHMLEFRFGCSPSSRYFPDAYATEISQLDSDEFKVILGYLNTNISDQKKGAGGSAK